MNPKRKIVLAVALAVIVITVSLVAVLSQSSSGTNAGGKLNRVACLGDSITEITGYPSDLQALLGNTSAVGNFGVSGATVTFNSEKAYFFQPEFRDAAYFSPTTVIIMLGTNNARTDNYLQINSFVVDYERIISRIEKFGSSPQVFIVEPPPIFNNTLNLNSTDFAQGVIPRIIQVANTLKLPLIDVYTPLINHPEYFSDGVHPDSEGTQIIANIIYNAVKADSPQS